VCRSCENGIARVVHRLLALTKGQSGVLYEIPLLFSGYGVLLAIFLPTLFKYLNAKAAIVILIITGAGISYLAGLSITAEQRLRIAKVPMGIWIYLGISLFSVPLMVSVAFGEGPKGRLSSLAIPLLIQSFLAFWLDYRLAVWSEKKRSRG
jgi:hypothetical protein